MDNQETGHPVFEIVEPDRHIRIYANGVVEGCDLTKVIRIVNHLPMLAHRDWFAYFSKLPDTNFAIANTVKPE